MLVSKIHGFETIPSGWEVGGKSWVVEDQCLNWCMKLIQILPDDSIELNFQLNPDIA